MGSVEGISFGTEIHPVGNLISLRQASIAVAVDIRCIKSQHQVRAFQQITQYIFHTVSCFPLGAGGIRIPRKGIDLYSCNADFGTEDMLTGVENQFEIMERMNDIAVVNGETEDNIMLSMLRLKEIHHCNAGKALDMIENALMNGILLSQLF